MCSNVLVNNEAMLIPAKDLFGRVSKLTAVLQSENIKKVNDEWLWKVDKILLTYNHEKQSYVESSEFTGELKFYESTIPKGGTCLYVKESKILENVKSHATEMIAKTGYQIVLKFAFK
ncbi:hypothetical protein EB796_002513 [Bugula neritina]|uniref:Uncharacterized protein n=1 Tax=Bugula neritina TaxID=10212 RepID=A0A7J7KLZ3_BUGNE|nr:hypothetical protein EB796_002513 [Bugula neritina]